MAVKLGINGFGRIGRMVLRASLNHPDVTVTAINDLSDIKTLQHLLAFDSVHGKLSCSISEDERGILVGEDFIQVTSIKDPAQIPWGDAGADIVAECTGIFKDRESASSHLKGGCKKVIISAPSKDPDATIVMGVNHDAYDPVHHTIVSNASCTTNCLAPVAKVLMDRFGIVSGMMTTVHAYTGDQRLLDFPHRDLRRARAANLSMIPTTTGAAKAVSLVIPELKGKLNGISVRVPTPNVSLVDLCVIVEKDGVIREDVNDALKQASEQELAGILGFCELPLVSIDFNGSALSSIVDAISTDVIGNLVKVLSWYDNEAGYSSRMIDLAALIGKSL